ncbi:DUF2510 domain-containing protein [Mycobacterium alsense]|nr:DUF2510 domain-containing protein [Mycobacterium alsense]
MTTPPSAPDWYPDPSGKPGQMYWDGQQWHSAPPADQPPRPTPTTPRRRGRPALIAALVVALVVLAGVIGVTGFLLQHRHTSPAPAAQPAQPAPPAQPTSSAVSSAAAPAPRVGAQELAPFLGEWGGGHSGRIEIHPDGSGRWRYPDVSTCPDAPLAGCGVIGTADFMLTSVTDGTAKGRVTASSNPVYASVGGPVTIVQGKSWQGTGVVLAVSIGRMGGWNFCNDTSPHNCAES